jgi:ketosteroid isomerase-like protein
MTAEENKKTASQWLDAMNRGDISEIDKAIEESYSPDFVLHDPNNMPGLGKGPQVMKNLSRQILSGQPGVQNTLEDIILEGDKLACRVMWSSTDKMTCESRNIEVIAISQFSNGKIIGTWELVVQVPVSKGA